jgi:hypothetical protein
MKFSVLRTFALLILCFLIIACEFRSEELSEYEREKTRQALELKVLDKKLSGAHRLDYENKKIIDVLEAIYDLHAVNVFTYLSEMGGADALSTVMNSHNPKVESLSDLLDLIVKRLEEKEVPLKWIPHKGCVVITNQENALGFTVVLKVYDVRPLLLYVVAYKGPQLSLGEDGQGLVFKEDEREVEDYEDGSINGDDIVKVIRQMTGDDDTWIENCNIEIRNGFIHASNTLEVHEKIEKVLNKMLKSNGRKQIVTLLKFWQLPFEQYKKFEGLSVRKTTKLNKAQKKMLDQHPDYCIDRILTTSMNAQNAHSAMLFQETVVKDIDSSKKGQVKIEMADLTTGTVVDIRTVLQHNTKRVTSTVSIDRFTKQEGDPKLYKKLNLTVSDDKVEKYSYRGSIDFELDQSYLLDQSHRENHEVLVTLEQSITAQNTIEAHEVTVENKYVLNIEKELKKLNPERFNKLKNQECRTRLNRKHKCHYKNIHIKDLFQKLSEKNKISFVLDEGEVDEDFIFPWLPFKGLSLKSCLQYLKACNKVDLPFHVVENKIYIGNLPSEKNLFQLYVYDIRHLILVHQNYSSHNFKHLGQNLKKDPPAEIEVHYFTDGQPSGDEFVELIQERTGEELWEEEGATIESRNGYIVLNHSLNVHKQVAQILAEMSYHSNRHLSSVNEIWSFTKKEYQEFKNLNSTRSLELNKAQEKFIKNKSMKDLYRKIQINAISEQTVASTKTASHRRTKSLTLNEGRGPKVEWANTKHGFSLTEFNLISNNYKSMNMGMSYDAIDLYKVKKIKMPSGNVIELAQFSEFFSSGNMIAPIDKTMITHCYQIKDKVYVMMVSKTLQK